MNPKVDEYLQHTKRWRAEMEALRAVALDCGLTEELKWGKPCYTHDSSNVLILYSLKEYCAVGFMRGSLLADPEEILVAPGENSQAARWMKFSDVDDIAERESTLRAFVEEAIGLVDAGIKVEFTEKHELVFPEELVKKFEAEPEFKDAFDALTPGRQRGWNLHFSGAKQSKPRDSRIEKAVPRIMDGKGRNDR